MKTGARAQAMRDKARLILVVVIVIMSVGALAEAFDHITVRHVFSGPPQRQGLAYPEVNLFRREDESTRIEGNLSKEEALFRLKGRPGIPYLRVKVGEEYKDGFWSFNGSSLKYSGEDLNLSEPKVYQNRTMWTVEVKPQVPLAGFIPAAKDSIRVSANRTLQLDYYPEEGLFYSDNLITEPYNLTYVAYKYRLDVLRSLTTTPDERYLSVPSSLKNKLKDLAELVTTGITGPYDKARAIEDFLKHNYAYKIWYSRAPNGSDPVEWFLFNSKEGVCGHFNSAFVLLARSIGLPARLCVGYRINPDSTIQNVTSDMFHAYAEIYFNDAEWITFDATDLSSGSSSQIWWESGEEPYEEEGNIVIVYPLNGTHISPWEIRIEGKVLGNTLKAVTIDDERFTQVERSIIWDESTGVVAALTYSYGFERAFAFTNRTRLKGEVVTTIRCGNFSAGVRFIVDDPSPKRHATSTEITSNDYSVRKGSMFTVLGKVTSSDEGAISGLNVHVLLTKDKNNSTRVLSGWGVVSNGRFNVSCEAPSFIEVGDYHLIAKTYGDGLHEPSESDPQIMITADTEIQISMPDKVIANRTFQIFISLVEKASQLHVVNQSVSLKIGDLLSWDIQTGADDWAWWVPISVKISSPGSYNVSVVYPGQGYFLGTSSSRELKAVGMTIAPATDRLLRGEENVIIVRAFAEDLTLASEYVNVFLDGMTVGGGRADANGIFTTKFRLPSHYELGNHAVQYTVGELGDYSITSTVKVMSRTSITTSASTYEVTAKLLDNNGQPIPDEPIKISGDALDAAARTNDTGCAVLSVFGFRDYNYTIAYGGSELYLPSTASGSFKVPLNVVASIWIMLGVSIILPGLMMIALLKLPGVLYAASHRHQVEVKKVQQVAVKRSPLRVEYPQISSPLPPVWGAGDPLTIIVRSSSPSVRTVDLRVDGGGSEKLELTGGAGGVTVTLEKGLHQIRVTCEEGSSDSTIKAVVYREEVVDLFNELFEKLRLRHVDVKGGMTAREMGLALRGKLQGRGAEALNESISLFEAANFSLHSVGRGEFERMYLLAREVIR